MDDNKMSEETPQSTSRRTFIKGVIAAGAAASSSAYLFRSATLHGQPSAAGVAKPEQQQGQYREQVEQRVGVGEARRGAKCETAGQDQAAEQTRRRRPEQAPPRQQLSDRS